MKTVKLLLAGGVYAPLCMATALIFLFNVFPTPSLAQTVYWDFSGGSRSGNSSVSYVSPGSASTGPGVSTSGFPDEACSNDKPWSVRGWYNTSTIFEARNKGEYVAFPLSVDAGESFHITGISFRSNRSVNAAGDEFGPYTWVMYASHNNYSTIVMSGRNSSGTTGTSASCDFHSKSVDIPLRGGEGITFRIYAYGGASTEITTMRFDDFIVNGTRLPIGLSYFTARLEDSGVQLNWQTHNEQSNAYMAIERSADGHQFREIGRVSGVGTTSQLQDYYYMDTNPLPGLNYYRMRQVDFDGAEHIHHVVSVRVQSKGERIRLFPTLATDHLTIHYPQAAEQTGSLLVFNTLGRVVRQIDVPQGALQQQFNISDLVRGTYLIQYREGRRLEVLGPFIKQ